MSGTKRKVFEDWEEMRDKCETILDKGNVKITLNGKPAVIRGFKNKFPTVTQMDTLLSAEWNWFTVHHIITRSNSPGSFTTP